METSIYLERNTFLHKLDPRTKIFGAIFLFALTLIFNHPVYLFVLFCFIFAILIISKSFVNLKRVWILFVLLFLFSTILWPFFVKGKTPLIEIGILDISYESLLYGIAMGERLTSMLVIGVIFLSTTKIEEFSFGLQKMGVPFVFSFVFSFAFRLVPTFIGTASSVVQAQKARGLDIHQGNIFQKIKKHIPLIIPIFIYAIRNANFLAMALEVKGFGKRKKIEEYIELKMKFYDYTVLLFLLAVLIFCIFLRIQGFGTVINRI